jgi:hypothetical protein
VPDNTPAVEVQLTPAGLLVIVPVPAPEPLTDRVNVGAGENVAPTVTAEVPMVNVQEPVPEQAPLQPSKTNPPNGFAFNVTKVLVLIALLLVHVPEVTPAVEVQLMPPVPVTEPLPVPAPVTVTVVALKAALTDCAAVMLTEQAPVPVQAPPHPAKAVPAGAVGVRATEVPCVNGALQVPPPELQLAIPAGELLIVSELGPVALTVNVNCGAGEKDAPTVTGALPMVKMQGPVPVQTPLQPLKMDPAVGLAVSVTVSLVLMALLFVHVPEVTPEVEVQLMPPVPLTVPAPVPVPVTVTVVALKAALTACAAVMVTEQVPVPLQAPPQPAKADPAGTLGVRSTVAPLV